MRLASQREQRLPRGLSLGLLLAGALCFGSRPATAKDPIVFTGHTNTVRAVAFAPDGQTVASASSDKTIRLWDVATGKRRTLIRDTEAVLAVAFAPDGNTLASSSKDKVVTLWNAASGKELVTFRGFSAPVLFLAFTPNGRLLATISSGEKVVSGSGTWPPAKRG